MWTPTTRLQHNRPVTRYQTDLTDAEWRVIAPYLPKPCATGRPREWPMREIVNGIFYVMRAGCPWRLVPSDLPPWETIYRWFAVWRDDGRFERINHALVMADRERIGRGASPSAAIIDSQSVKTAEAGGPRGYDAGKKVNGRKRHALVDTDGRGLVLEPHPASIQDRDSGGPLLRNLAAYLPVHSARLRRQRICRGEGHHGHVDRRRNRSQKSRPNRLRRKPAPLGRRTVLRLDRAQSETGKRLRGHHQLSARIPLCRLRHAPRASDCPRFMTFETNS